MNKNNRTAQLKLFAFLLALWMVGSSIVWAVPTTGQYKCFGKNVGGVGYFCGSGDAVLLLFSDGSYRKTNFSSIDVEGTFSVKDTKVTFSQEKIWGPGTIKDIGGTRYLEFQYTSQSGYLTTITYFRYGDVPPELSSSENAISQKSMSEVKLNISADDGGCCIKPEQGVGGTISFTPPKSGSINITILTPSGESVYNNSTTVTAGAKTTLGWDGKNSSGNKPVSAGSYILHIEGAGMNQTKKIVVVK